MSELTFPFDPTGNSPTNKIVDETHVLSSASWDDYHLIIPRAAPFFRNSLIIKKQPGNIVLTEGVDWVATHRFISASRNTAKPIYGSISFYDKTFYGTISLEYQTLGGDYILEYTKLLEVLSNLSTNPRITSWEQIADHPGLGFPSIEHVWNLEDMVGIEDVVLAIQDIAQAIRDKNDNYYTKQEVDDLLTALRNELTPQGV